MWRNKEGKWDWERAFDLFEKLKRQDLVIGRQYTGATMRVAAGEVGIFWLTPASSAARLAVMKKAPLGLIAFPKFFGGLRTYSIPKGAPHPASAWLLVDYLTSPEGQFEFTDKAAGVTPLNRKAKPGRLAKWVMDRGGTVENMNLIDLSMLEEIYSPEVQEKSEQFFFKLVGLR
jgi:ABC-type Fe3+ transport system substrate-binding protein